jgi:uncharacterized membrane protein
MASLSKQHKTTDMLTQRNRTIDSLRGASVLLMIVFHFVYDLNHFNFMDIALFSATPYIIWRAVIISMFLLAVGMSLVYAYQKYFDLKKYLKRLRSVGFGAIGISIVTYFIFPDEWIFFGILHLIFIGSLLSVWFVNYPKVALLIALGILTLSYFSLLDTAPLRAMFGENLPKYSLDVISIFPWISVIFIGIFIAHNQTFQTLNIHLKWLDFMGRHALTIYLTHQLILFSLVGGVYYFNTYFL